MSDRGNVASFGLTNNKGIAGLVNPVQIEMLKDLDVQVLRGSPEDAKAKWAIPIWDYMHV
jgi:hypothetical protein